MRDQTRGKVAVDVRFVGDCVEELDGYPNGKDVLDKNRHGRYTPRSRGRDRPRGNIRARRRIHNGGCITNAAEGTRREGRCGSTGSVGTCVFRRYSWCLVLLVPANRPPVVLLLSVCRFPFASSPTSTGRRL